MKRACYHHSISVSLIVITLQGIITSQPVSDITQIQYNQLDVKYRLSSTNIKISQARSSRTIATPQYFTQPKVEKRLW